MIHVTLIFFALSFFSEASLAQPLFDDDARSMRQFPPTLTALPLHNIEVEKVAFEAVALFEYDTDRLRPESRAALAEFVGKLKGARLGMIRAVGHADRTGSESYNQILSEDRAEAVRAYLISKGVDPDRVRTEGRGATQPVTTPGDCTVGGRTRIIACLQPDRRVGIEVAGTRPSTAAALLRLKP